MPHFRLSRVALALAPFLMAGCASVPLADGAKPAEPSPIAGG